MGGKDVLKANEAKCVGCKVCEIVCSLYNLGVVAPHRARIKVNIVDEFTNTIVHCHHCNTPFCKEACPNDAFYTNEAGALQVDGEKCTVCGLCAEACPFKAIKIDDKINVAVKCDLCNGLYTCVEYCPQGALQKT